MKTTIKRISADTITVHSEYSKQTVWYRKNKGRNLSCATRTIWEDNDRLFYAKIDGTWCEVEYDSDGNWNVDTWIW